MLSEGSQTRVRQYDFTCRWNVNNKTNEQTDSYIQRTGGCQRGGAWGDRQNREKGLKATKLQLYNK